MKRNLHDLVDPVRLIAAVAVFVSVSMLLAGCAGKPAARPVTPKDIDELNAEIAKALERNGVPGVGLAVVNKEQVLFAGGLGAADVASNRPVTANTAFRVGSITKSFVALCALRLQEEGKLNLDAKVTDLAPEIPVENRWDATDPVRVVHLLEHTAGFNDFSLAEFFDFDAPPETPLMLTLQRFPGPQRVRWRPGTYVSYSNPGYGFAGYIVEKVAGEDFGSYVARTILKPLGMNSSDMVVNDGMAATLARGYAGNPPMAVPYHPIYLRPAGDLKSTPADMARFVRMMLGRGQLDGVRIVSEESIARMEVPKTSLAARSGLVNGYGLGNYAGFGRPFVTHGHDGGIDGFLSRYAYIPDQGVGYFFSINNTSGDAMRIIDSLLFRYVTRGAQKPKSPVEKLDGAAQRFEGFYEVASPRQEVLKFGDLLAFSQIVRVRDGKLFGRNLSGGEYQLLPAGENLFRDSRGPIPSAVFTANAEGEAVFAAAFPPDVPMPIAFVKKSPVWPITRLALLLGAATLMLSSVLFALIWIPRKMFGRMRGVKHLSVRLVPLLATIALLLFIALPMNGSPIVLAQPNAITIATFAASIAFAVLSILALVLAVRSFRWEMNRFTRIHSCLVAAACFGLTWYFAYWGMIGFRTWAPW
ncbi:MAG: serine hydrolase domain-containing protein [Candidatus Binataceae bacterium]